MNFDVAAIKTDKETATQRFAHCVFCPQLNKLGICRNCGCIMKVKVWLKNAWCPEKKW